MATSISYTRARPFGVACFLLSTGAPAKVIPAVGHTWLILTTGQLPPRVLDAYLTSLGPDWHVSRTFTGPTQSETGPYTTVLTLEHTPTGCAYALYLDRGSIGYRATAVVRVR